MDVDIPGLCGSQREQEQVPSRSHQDRTRNKLKGPATEDSLIRFLTPQKSWGRPHHCHCLVGVLEPSTGTPIPDALMSEPSPLFPGSPYIPVRTANTAL